MKKIQLLKHVKRTLAIAAASAAVLSLAACTSSTSDETSAAEETVQEQTADSQSQEEETEAASQASREEPEGSDETFYLTATNTPEWTARMRHCWVDNGYFYQQLTFRALFLADHTLQNVEPDLASGYEISDDGLVYTITMKDNLKWSDGEPLTAQDVAFSIKTLLRASQANGIYTTAFGKIEGADAWIDQSADDLAGVSVSGNTITLTLSEPCANMIQVLAQFVIYPEHCLADADPLEIHNNVFWEKPVGSGMYYVSEFNAGNYFVLEPNPYYEGEAPHIQKVQVNFVGNNIAEAQGGHMDYFDTNAPSDISEMDKLSAYQKYPVDMMFYRYFICNLQDMDGNVNQLIADKRVRQAFMYAIDTESLISSIFPDLATRTCTGVPSYDSRYDSSLDQYPYDPEKARQLLEEANYDFSTPLRIRYYYTDQSTIDFMEAIAYYLGEVGITCDVQMFQESGTQGMFITRDYDLTYKGLSAFDISEWYSEYTSSNKNFQNILGGNTVFDDLTNQLMTTTDADQQAEILKELQALEQEELLKLPLATFKSIIYINRDRVWIPDDVEFGNPRYRYDMQFEQWKMY